MERLARWLSGYGLLERTRVGFLAPTSGEAHCLCLQPQEIQCPPLASAGAVLRCTSQYSDRDIHIQFKNKKKTFLKNKNKFSSKLNPDCGSLLTPDSSLWCRLFIPLPQKVLLPINLWYFIRGLRTKYPPATSVRTSMLTL